jgi:predicted nuclease of predicted toxin-antitoxin system
MARFLIDVNLPYRFSLWAGDEFMFARDLGERWSDSEIWAYARAHDLIIVSKDADFSDRALVSRPPPKVIHIRFGNLRMRDFHGLIRRQWPEIVALITDYRLVTAYRDRIEAID